MSVFSPGLRLHDRYTLVEHIGAGGMSEVWRATDELLGRAVAVKALVARLATDPVLREATWREARAVARLTHPNVTQVYDYGEAQLPDGGLAAYLVMELVEGETLAGRLAGGPVPWREAARVGGQVAAALAAAHRLGVVHRDIKPGNVILTEAGVKVLDFGIAAVAGRADAAPGRLVGTPRFAAPERLDVAAPAQPAGDVYSLGALVYEALVGRPLARLRTWPEAAAAHRAGLTVPPLSVPGLPDRVARLCMACLSPDPHRRPTARQVASELADAAGEADQPAGATVPAPAAGALTSTRVEDSPVPARAGGRRLFASVGLALALVALAVALLLTAIRSDPPDLSGPPGAAPEAGAEPGPSAGTEPPDGPAGAPAPETPQDLVAALDREVTRAFDDDGTITRDAFEDLRDRVDGLRDALEENLDKRDEKLAEAAEDMRREIEDLRRDDQVDQATSDRLTGLLDSLRNG